MIHQPTADSWIIAAMGVCIFAGIGLGIMLMAVIQYHRKH